MSRHKLAKTRNSVLLLLSILPQLAFSQVTLTNGLQSQYPPVARTDEEFFWAFLDDTFVNSGNEDDSLVYSVSGLPEWCDFDANTRTFAGYPDETGNSWVLVTANATDGSSSAQDGFTLIVSDQDAPIVNLSIPEQLPTALTLGSGYVSIDHDALRVPPGWSFSIGLEPYTFSSPSDSLLYYAAYERGSTTLPDWLRFDNNTFTFSSDSVPTNSNDNSENSYDIVLVASDHYGYGDVTQNFSIVTSQHYFQLLSHFPPINATTHTQVNYTIPMDLIALDNRTATGADVNITVNLTDVPFLTYHSDEFSLTGSLPDSLPDRTDITFPAVIHSTFGSSLLTNITLHVIPNIFTEHEIPDLKAKPDEYLSLDLWDYAADHNATYSADIDPPEATWVAFDPNTMILSAVLPKELPSYDDVTIHFEAIDNTTGIYDTAKVKIKYAELDGNLNGGSNSKSSHQLQIALATTFGFIALMIILYLLYRLRHRLCPCLFGAGGAATRKRRSKKGISSSQIRRVNDQDSSMAHSATSTMFDDKDSALFGDMLSPALKKEDGQGSPQQLHGNVQQQQDDSTNGEQLRQHNIIVITDGAGDSYHPDLDDPDGHQALGFSSHPSHSSIGSHYQSTIRSNTSSSLWYSDVDSGFESPSTPGSTDAASQTPKRTPSNGLTPPPPRSRSTPRQRSDFKPLNNQTSSSLSPTTPPPPMPDVQLGTAYSTYSPDGSGDTPPASDPESNPPVRNGTTLRVVDFGPQRTAAQVNAGDTHKSQHAVEEQNVI